MWAGGYPYYSLSKLNLTIWLNQGVNPGSLNFTGNLHRVWMKHMLWKCDGSLWFNQVWQGLVTQGWFHRNHPTEKSSATIYRPTTAWGLHLFVPRLLESQRFWVAMGGSQWNTIISHRWCGSSCWRLAVKHLQRIREHDDIGALLGSNLNQPGVVGHRWILEDFNGTSVNGHRNGTSTLWRCISCFEIGIFHCHGRLPEGSVSGKPEYFMNTFSIPAIVLWLHLFQPKCLMSEFLPDFTRLKTLEKGI